MGAIPEKDATAIFVKILSRQTWSLTVLVKGVRRYWCCQVSCFRLLCQSGCETKESEAVEKQRKELKMASSEKFCLRWNDSESNISVAFRELRDDKDFFDVTLACDEEQIQAHKVILSACSPFFRSILRKNPHAHPLLYLRGVRFRDLQSVLNFMYHGEVNVAQEELNSFLMVAEELKVKGLTQTQSEGAKASPAPGPSSTPSRPESQPMPLLAASSPLPSTPPPAKRPRPSTAPSLSFPNNSQPEVQEVSMPPVKSEPV